ncbi:MAG: NifU family protein, partial [Planctomycetota bacterium]
WHFDRAPAAEESPLVAALFSADADVESVLLDGPRVVITRKAKYNRDWKPLAQTVGVALRAQLESGQSVLSEALKAKRLTDDEIRQRIQMVIDNEVNPGVAGHGGQVSIVKIENNAVTVNMGGGCQGCSSAAVTLKGGIERSFRQAVPTLGALHDATDHSAGTNPFFT